MIAVAFSSKLMLQPFLRYNKKCHFPTTLSTFFLTSSVFLKSILFSLFLFVRLRKWTLSQRVETCNGVKWRLASPGDSDGPAKPTLLDGNVLTERRSDRTVRGEIRSESMKQCDACVNVNLLTLLRRSQLCQKSLQENIIRLSSSSGSRQGYSDKSAFLFVHNGSPLFCYTLNT